MRRTTLVLNRREIAGLLSMGELIDAIRDAYVARAVEPDVAPQRAVARWDQTSAVVSFPGALPGYATVTVKVNAKTPTNVGRGLPFLIGTILLLDRATGAPLAVLESGLVTAMRTAAAGAVGVLALARPDARRAALIGAGVQAAWQLRALHAARRLDAAVVYDVVPGHAAALAADLSRELALPVEAVPTIEAAAARADVLVAVTPSRVPIITRRLVRPGMHVNAFGADEPGKVEVDADVLAASVVVVDDRRLAVSDGALNVAFAEGRVPDPNAFAEMGEVLAGRRRGRTSPHEVTVFGNVGLAFQDLVASDLVYRRALAAGVGTPVVLVEPGAR